MPDNIQNDNARCNEELDTPTPRERKIDRLIIACADMPRYKFLEVIFATHELGGLDDEEALDLVKGCFAE